MIMMGQNELGRDAMVSCVNVLAITPLSGMSVEEGKMVDTSDPICGPSFAVFINTDYKLIVGVRKTMGRRSRPVKSGSARF